MYCFKINVLIVALSASLNKRVIKTRYNNNIESKVN